MVQLIATISTVMVMITFIVIIAWAWSGKRSEDFEEASRLPFDDNAPTGDK
ncbi:MAG: cbb3-type cytochrome c oxidase subunit 3 [Arenicellales bacterium]